MNKARVVAQTGPAWGLLVPAIVASALGCAQCPSPAAPQTEAATPPPAQAKPSASTLPFPATFSGNMPNAIPAHDTKLPPEQARPYFDLFSWQSFIALMWPAAPDVRGEPLNPNDPQAILTMKNTAPSVWTSYKNQWDLFGQGTNSPTPWSSWTDPVSPCSDAPSPGAAATSHVFGLGKGGAKGGLRTDMSEAFSVPLIDQKNNYTLFEIRYNKDQYEFVRSNALYLKSNLVKWEMAHGGGIEMPLGQGADQGAMMVKAAWRELTPNDDASRYYVLDDTVYDPVKQKCVPKKLGLVGLHIVRKIKGFKQWIWSSFEQVDNVKEPGAKAPFTYNDGSSTPATPRGYANKPNGTGVQPSDREPPRRSCGSTRSPRRRPARARST